MGACDLLIPPCSCAPNLLPFPSRRDIATAMSLGVDTPFTATFFALAVISIVYVQLTFYWLMGSRSETVTVDLYRGEPPPVQCPAVSIHLHH